jgi:hypothetical protein
LQCHYWNVRIGVKPGLNNIPCGMRNVVLLHYIFRCGRDAHRRNRLGFDLCALNATADTNIYLADIIEVAQYLVGRWPSLFICV